MEYREAELDHKQNADEPAQEFRERRSQLDDEIEKRRARISNSDTRNSQQTIET